MKKKNIELRIYESLGIKTFRKMLFKLVYILIIPITYKMTREERYSFIYNTPSNYVMKKGYNLQVLRDFKKLLLFNASVHIYSLLASIPNYISIIKGTIPLFDTIITFLVTTINIYCIMLQRYNQIRINQVIKKYESKEKIKKNELTEELIKEDSLLLDHTYKIVNKNDKEKTITFEELLENATYEQLKQYRKYLSCFKAVSQNIDYYFTPDEKLNIIKQYCMYYSEVANQDIAYYFAPNETLNIHVPLQKNKRLKLELKKPKKD